MEAIMDGAGEGAGYFVRGMNARASLAKKLSHADGALHFILLKYAVPIYITQKTSER